MLKRRILSVILVLAMLIPAAYAAQPAQDGMRGVWVSSVANIDYPSQQGLSADQLKSEADTILDVYKRQVLHDVPQEGRLGDAAVVDVAVIDLIFTGKKISQGKRLLTVSKTG